MNIDPDRLLVAQNADPLERELLSSLQALTPPAGAQAQAWDGLSRQLALAGLLGAAAAAPKSALAATTSTAGTSSAASTTSTAGAGKALLAKGVLGKTFGASVTAKALVGVGIVGLGVVGVSTHAYLSPSRPDSRSGVAFDAANSVANVEAAHGTPAAESVVLSASAVPVAELGTARPCSDEPCIPPQKAQATPQRANDDALARESALLVQARTALRAGDVAGARERLLQLQTRFARGMLSQEREVLNIEVLSASGERKAASRRARLFIAKYPKSPHAAALARFVDER